MKRTCVYIAAWLLICATVSFGAQAAIAADAGSAIKADSIMAEPYRDAKAVGALKVGDKVTIIKRDGAWYQLSSPKKGWVKMLSIKKGDGAGSSSTSSSSVASLASGRAGTGKVVSTTGVRGLNEEELKAAKFDENELKLAESYAVSKADAAKFAAKAKLKARSVGYLP